MIYRNLFYTKLCFYFKITLIHPKQALFVLLKTSLIDAYVFLPQPQRCTIRKYSNLRELLFIIIIYLLRIY